jgi:phage baseplate assembly protein W
MSSYLALEFVHPDFGRRPGEIGLVRDQTGLRLAENRTLSAVDGTAAVRQAILILLTTRPGERVMRTDYGCQLQSLTFAPNDQTTAGLAIHYVRQALERWEPRIRIQRIDAERNPENPELLDIYLEYRVLASNRTEHLEIAISLSGRET